MQNQININIRIIDGMHMLPLWAWWEQRDFFQLLTPQDIAFYNKNMRSVK